MIWDYRYDGPNCPDGCAGLSLPANSIAECPDDYKLSIGEIRSLYLSPVQVGAGGKIEASNKPSNWLSEDGYSGLTALVGFGDKPLPDTITAPLPGFENRTIDRSHTINFDSTDAKQENLDLARTLQCGKKVAVWVITHDGIAYGGPDGIVAEVNAGIVMTRGQTPLSVNFVFTWNNKFEPLSGEVAGAASLIVGPGPAQFNAPPPPPLGGSKSSKSGTKKAA